MKLLLLCFVIFSPFGLVNSTGYLTIQFIEYSSDGRTASDEPCDAPVRGVPMVHGRCDPQFLLTAYKYTYGKGEKQFVYQQLNHYSNQDVVTFGQTFGQVANPVVIGMNFNESSGTILIEIIVNDFNGYEDKALMSTFTTKLKTISSVPQHIKLQNGNSSSISFNYHYSCNGNYYGRLCHTYCRTSDDNDDGHKWCSPAGEKVCLFGWVGASTDCKQPHPCRTCVCQHGGTCVPQGEGYTCHCPPDYSGSKCETCDPKVSKCKAKGAEKCSCDLAAIQPCT